jgi:hypothetical protein
MATMATKGIILARAKERGTAKATATTRKMTTRKASRTRQIASRTPRIP